VEVTTARKNIPTPITPQNSATRFVLGRPFAEGFAYTAFLFFLLSKEAPVAATSLFALIDDIASILDDVALMTKVAAKKTAGVLGDDLALNAEQVSGVRAERELPVVWAVARGSLRNKLILVPTALAVSALIPWAITPLLMLGGAYLCYEGIEKLARKWLHDDSDNGAGQARVIAALAAPDKDLVALEKSKIEGAIRTDFVLSAEIIVITLGTVAGAPFLSQLTVLAGIAVVMTIGVYGIVAGIVKLDDGGLLLTRKSGPGLWARGQRRIGRLILRAAPMLMKALSVIGTIAMFLVGGGILTHGMPGAHQVIEQLLAALASVPILGAVPPVLGAGLLDGLAGMLAGVVVLAFVALGKHVVGKRSGQ
jgi:predicted DNA repair protein MutK